MHICFFANAQNVHTIRFARHFASQGHTITVITLRPNSIQDINIFCFRLPGKIIKHSQLNFLLSLIPIQQLLQIIKPDLIHAHQVTPYGFLAALSQQYPVLITAWGSDILTLPGQSWPYRWSTTFSLKRARLITTVAQHMTNILRGPAFNISNPIVTLPFGADTSIFNQERLPAPQAAMYQPIIVSTRHLEELYDVGTLIQAAALVLKRYPAARFIIAGQGSQSAALKKLAGDINIAQQCLFIGRQSPEQIACLLKQAMLFISTSRSDGNNISLNEAMACGTFPIVSDIPANREWLEESQTGLFFPPGDYQRLAEAMLYAIEQPTLRQAAAQANWQRIMQGGTWSKNMQQMERYYWQVAQETLH